jgi:hypothetical protein
LQPGRQFHAGRQKSCGIKNGLVMTDVGDHRQIEIRQLEQDLDNLRRRHAELDAAVGYLKIGFVLFVVALIALIIWAATIDNGALAAALFILLMIAAALAYLGPRSMSPFWAFGGPEPRWIDVVSRWKGANRSEAMAVEDMIADRKQRLAALRASTAAPHQAVPPTLTVPRLREREREGAERDTSNTRFIAVVGAVLVVLIGVLAFQKISRCRESGGTACCFGRLGCPPNVVR